VRCVLHLLSAHEPLCCVCHLDALHRPAMLGKSPVGSFCSHHPFAPPGLGCEPGARSVLPLILRHPQARRCLPSGKAGKRAQERLRGEVRWLGTPLLYPWVFTDFVLWVAAVACSLPVGIFPVAACWVRGALGGPAHFQARLPTTKYSLPQHTLCQGCVIFLCLYP
jgi:hypothetical protein